MANKRNVSLEKAIEMLRAEYERASKLEFVYDPLAWALYRVWKRVSGGNGDGN